MLLEDCYVGQRVICVEPLDGQPDCVGKLGTIMSIRSGGYEIAIEFDEYFRGGGLWDCNGLCPSGNGRYGYAEQVEPGDDNIELDMSITDLF